MSRTFRHIPWEERYVASWRKYWYSQTGDIADIAWDDKDRIRNGYDGVQQSYITCSPKGHNKYLAGKHRRFFKREKHHLRRIADKKNIRMELMYRDDED